MTAVQALQSLSIHEDRDPSVLILAGGQSSRMGQDKALICWEGQPLLSRVCTVAQDISSHSYILSPWPQRYAAIVPKGIDQILEPSKGKGPLWALHLGLNHCETSWVLLLACDMPYLDSQRIQGWRSHLSSLPDSCMAYVPQTQSKRGFQWEPLCGFYRKSCQDSLHRFLAQGGRSFQHWLSTCEAIAIPVEPPEDRMFYNCNTPDDLFPH